MGLIVTPVGRDASGWMLNLCKNHRPKELSKSDKARFALHSDRLGAVFLFF
jgi:hypothetical protein